MAVDPVVYAPLVLFWAAVAYRLPAVVRSPGNRGLRAYWLTLLFLALAITVLVPGYRAVNAALDEPNVARLLGHGLALGAALTVQGFFLVTHDPGGAARRLRWRAVMLAAALAAMTVLFVLAPVDEETREWTVRYADAPYVREYWLVFLAYLSLALGTVARSSWRFAAAATDPALRIGLRLAAGGGLVGLGYVTNQALYLATRAFRLPYPTAVEDVSETLLAVATILLLAGSTMPAWGRHAGISALAGWWGRYRAYRRLEPLWRALSAAHPEIVLEAAPSPLRAAVAFPSLPFRLQRRIIEIHDGYLALRPFMRRQVLDQARAEADRLGLPETDRPAYVEARLLADALAGETDRPAREPLASEFVPVAQRPEPAEEPAYLQRVALWYTQTARGRRRGEADEVSTGRAQLAAGQASDG